MKKSLRFALSVFIVLVFVSGALADVAINALNFPDANFMAYVSDNFDTDRDGSLSDAEIERVSRINARPGNIGRITSLQGIEFFTSLVSLDVSGRNYYDSQLDEWKNPLSSLDLSKNTNLVYLDCSYNNLTTLNITQLTALISLDCTSNLLTELDVTKNTALTYLDCSSNRLTELNVSKSTALTYLECGGSLLTELDVSKNTALAYLDCDGSLLMELDVSHQNLQYLHCEANRLTALTLGKSINSLRSFCVSRNLIPNLNDIIKNLPDTLTMLHCARCGLTELDLSGKTDLVNLSVEGNMIESLDLSNINQLRYLNCSENNLKMLKLGNVDNLVTFICAYNQLAALDIPKGMGTKYGYDIYCSVQKINGLKLSEDKAHRYSLGRYVLDFQDYMSSEQIKNIVSSSIRAFDNNDDEISVAYEDGKAQFRAEPMYVKYIYNVGYEEYFEDRNEYYEVDYRMDVTISNGDLSTFSYNNHVYKFFDSSNTNYMSWKEAKEYCESLGGHLLTISSEEEEEALLEMFKKLNVRESFTAQQYWLGSENYGSGWSWITGEDFDDELFEINERQYVEHEYAEKTANLEILFDLMEEYGLGQTKFYANNDDLFSHSSFICEWEPASADLAKLSQEYLDWSADRQAHYHASNDLFGAIPEPVDYSHLASNPPEDSSFSGALFRSAALASKYDPRGSGVLPAVRNQNPYGTCWAFAALGALEASYAAQGIGSPAPDTSELHLAWFVYRDPRPKLRFKLNDENAGVLHQGGTAAKAISFLSRIGAAAEADLPYSQASSVEKLTAGKYPENYTNSIRLKEAYQLGSVTAANRSIVKNLVMQYGAVWIYFYYSDSGMKNGVSYYLPNYTPGENPADGYHAVDIVGWDDNYPRSNFRTSPSSNGAWLVRNSWGSGRHDGGYFWMSYEQEIKGSAVFIAGENNLEKTYGHDTQTDTASTGYRWSANIFRASKAESINEVAFHTRDNNTPYEVYIIKYGKNNPATPGIPGGKANLQGVLAYAGYHTLTLAEPVEVKAGEYFGVMVKLTPAKKYEFITAAQAYETISTSEIAIAGKSYFAMEHKDGTPTSADWIDGARLNRNSYSAAIKAFSTSSSTSSSPAQIQTSSLPHGGVNYPYSCTLSASGTRPITWTVSGLPNGLTHSSGKISGTPVQAGTYEVKITASNSLGSDSKTLELVIGTSSPNDEERSSSGGGGGCETGAGFAGLAAVFFAVMIIIKQI